MPSSFSFLLNSQSNSSSSSSENDSKSDQSDDDDVGYYKKRAIQNDNDMLERPSDHDDSCSQSDDDDDDDEKETDIFTASNNPRSHFITRQATLYDNDWPRKSLIDEKKLVNQDEETSSEIERNDLLFLDSNQHQLVSVILLKVGITVT
jgi:hypothetical protein